jgi:ABC-type branched-chain amino acid transport systems, periplasmic component
METYYHLNTEYLAKKGLKNVSVLYNATFPTFAQLAEKKLPELASKDGLTIVSNTAVQSTTQDFTSPTRLIADKKPDAVAILVTAPQAVTALKQLRQAGYTGPVVGTSVQGGGNLKSAGEYGVGVIFPQTFSAAVQDAKAQDFVKKFEAKFGQLPDQYAAEGYDAMWWIAKGIKASGSATRDGIQRGLTMVAGEGFEGAMGALTFEGNDVRVPGVLVKWDGKSEQLVTD